MERKGESENGGRKSERENWWEKDQTKIALFFYPSERDMYSGHVQYRSEDKKVSSSIAIITLISCHHGESEAIFHVCLCVNNNDPFNVCSSIFWFICLIEIKWWLGL
ncbi:hypothetical protein BCR41DRAFT_67843 [Lobosporangium transversale]|uniref:Uncharacterized protein n=1 Tax=Lobosporangium transversale TaxID=64571 RepID=A0A1Y2H2E8_9FUNG|nr:hypothetical protein BCR41DRAFT_67843 [Lobosporangium transversale]ORZ28161.1 hypothetical protein BCR41DRAFT_67843 [Lobosporangium transversale]|eukprot:XP_021885846.1 hypothetical protein BCR41DRAFT_67843 [Lobosporangium transversale]